MHHRHDFAQRPHHHAGPGGPEALIAKLRERGRHRGFGPGGFGGPGGGFGPRGGSHGFGPGGPRGGRRRKRGEIRDAILRLLEDRSMHGYEMIQEIEQRSEGLWTPSPGSVYPMLQMLEDETLIAHEERDGRKVFSLTDTGRAHVAEQLGEQPAPWEPREGEADTPHHRLFGELNQLMMAVRQITAVGDDAQIASATSMLERSRRELYGLLAGAPAAED